MPDIMIPEMQKLKKQYPAYKDIDDASLLQSVVKKYPVYQPIADRFGEETRDRATSFGASIGEAKKPIEQLPEFTREAVFQKGVESFADMAVARASGLTPEQAMKGKKDFENVMMRAPRVAMAVTQPLFAIGLEMVQQGKNALASTMQKEKYSPTDYRFLSELLPKGTPDAVRFASSLGESIIEVALLGAAGNQAKKGLLKETLRTLEKKFTKAGINLKTLPPEQLKAKMHGFLKGSSLEEEAIRLMKAKGLKLPAQKGIGQGAPPATTPLAIGKGAPVTPAAEVTLEKALAAAKEATTALKPKVPAATQAPVEKMVKTGKMLKTDKGVIYAEKVPESQLKESVSSKVEVTKAPAVIKPKPEVTVEKMKISQKDISREVLAPMTAGNPKPGWSGEIRKNGFAIDEKLFETKAQAQAWVDAHTGEMGEGVAKQYKTALAKKMQQGFGKPSADPTVIDVEGKASVEGIKAPVETPAQAKVRRDKMFAEAKARRIEKQTAAAKKISVEEGGKVEVKLRINGVDSVKKLTPQQLFSLKEQIRNKESSVEIIDSARQTAESKATKLEQEAEKILRKDMGGKRGFKDVLDDIGDVMEGTGAGASIKDVKKIGKANAALKRLMKDAETAGKKLSKYLGENLKLDEASVGAIVKATAALKSSTIAKKNYTKEELDALPPQVKDAVMSAKVAAAKTVAQEGTLKKRYRIMTESVSSNPATVTPETDPMLRADTLYNPADKTSRIVNARINAVLERKRARATAAQESKGKSPYTYSKIHDTPVQFQELEEKTGFPLFSKHMTDINQMSDVSNKVTADIMGALIKGLKKGEHSPESDAAIVKAILTGKVHMLEGEQFKTAMRIQNVFKDIEPKVKYLRMRNWIEGTEKPHVNKVKLMEEGKRIFKEKGDAALEQWVKDKDFGVIKGHRYLPADVLKGALFELKDTAWLPSDPHVRTRTAREQAFIDKPLLLRVNSYLKKVHADYYMRDVVRDLRDGLDSVKNMPFETYKGIRAWAREAQGIGIETGPVGDFLRKTRGQFFKATFIKLLPKVTRNLLQNVALAKQQYPLSTAIMKTVLSKRYKLSPTEMQYFKTHISQLSEIEREHFFLYDTFKDTGIFGKVDRAAVSIAKLYTKTDDINRMSFFKFFLSGLDKEISNYREGKSSFNKFMKNAGISTLSDLELKKVLSLKPEEARLEMARMMTEKIHARYKKRDRGTAAMSEAGEVFTTLLQFPKAVLGRFTDSAADVINGHSHQQRWSGAQVLAGNFLMMAVANEMYQQVWGRSTYYDPVLRKEVEYKPYTLSGMISSLNPGSFQTAHVALVAENTKLIAEIVAGKASGEMSDKEFMSKTKQILRNTDKLGEAYIPFVEGTMGLLESALDKKSYKLLSTSFEQMQKDYKAIERNKIERSWVNIVRHALGGGNIDEDEEKSTFLEQLAE